MLEGVLAGGEQEQLCQPALLDERQCLVGKDVRLARRHSLHPALSSRFQLRGRGCSVGLKESDSADESELEVARDAAPDEQVESGALGAQEHRFERECEALRDAGERVGQPLGRGRCRATTFFECPVV